MKFLFCSLANDGFLFPSIAVAQALLRHGHDVAFVTDITRATVVEEAGLRRISRGPKDGASFEIQSWFYPLSIAIQVKHVENALKIFPADVLVGQPLTIGPFIVRDRIGLPLAVLGLAPPLWPIDPENSEGQSRSAIGKRRSGRHREMMKIYNNARKLFQLPSRNEDFAQSPLLGDLYLAQSIPELWQARGCLADKIHPIGSCSWVPPRVDREIDEWLAVEEPTKPLIYAQFGRNFQRANPAQMLFSCLDEEHYRVTASLGRCDSEPETISDNFLVRDLVPQGKVLPHADAVICGGNSTAALGALTHGLPLLILYGGGEQPDVAEICSSAGVAIALPVADVAEIEILDSLHRLLNEKSFRQRAQELQHAFGRQGGARAAAERLVALAAESSLSGCHDDRMATAS